MKGEPGETGMKNGALVMGNAIIYLAMHPLELSSIKEEHDCYRG